MDERINALGMSFVGFSVLAAVATIAFVPMNTGKTYTIAAKTPGVPNGKGVEKRLISLKP